MELTELLVELDLEGLVRLLSQSNTSVSPGDLHRRELGGYGARSPRCTMSCSIVLPGDRVPMPCEQSFRGDNGGDLSQYLPPQHFGLNSQRPALIVINTHSAIAELLAKHPVLLAKVVNDLQSPLVHPSGNGDRQKTEWVENSLGFQSLLSPVRGDNGTPANSARSNFRTLRDGSGRATRQ
jgi:hypothetical protein